MNGAKTVTIINIVFKYLDTHTRTHVQVLAPKNSRRFCGILLKMYNSVNAFWISNNCYLLTTMIISCVRCTMVYGILLYVSSTNPSATWSSLTWTTQSDIKYNISLHELRCLHWCLAKALVPYFFSCFERSV